MGFLLNDGNPYVGLRPFNESESLLFFGRQKQIDDLITILHDHHFLMVLGASGCGKSSLIRAGLIPRLRAGMLVQQYDKWSVGTMKPGTTPLESFADTIVTTLSEMSEAPGREDTIEAITNYDMHGLFNLISPCLHENHCNFMILIDQFEELFRFSSDNLSNEYHENASQFVSMLLACAQFSTIPFFVIATMRSDFIGDCDQFLELPEAINRGHYLVPRLTREQRRQAIESPARLFGGELAPRLLDHLLNQPTGNQDQLPVLQHLLMRMWRFRNPDKNKPLDFSLFETTGGLENALSLHAEEALKECNEVDLPLLGIIFKLLTDTDSSNRQIRRPARLSEINSVTGIERIQILKLLEPFQKSGRTFIIISDPDATGDSLVDISHESLIRGWKRLQDWVREEAKSRAMYIRLREAANRYAEDQEGLWRDPELQLAQQWEKEHEPSEAWAKRYGGEFSTAMNFLRESIDAREKHTVQIRKIEARKKRNFALGIIGVLTTLVVILVLVLSIGSYRVKLKMTAIKNQELEVQNDLEQLKRKNAESQAQKMIWRRSIDSLFTLGKRLLARHDSIGAASKLFERTKTLALQENDSNMLAEILLAQVQVAVLVDSIPTAERLLDSALLIGRETNNFTICGQVYEKRAGIFEMGNQIDSAYFYFNRAYENSVTAGNHFQVARILERLSVFDKERNRYDSALVKLHLAQKRYTLLADQLAISRINNMIDEITPWGYLVNLITAKIHVLREDKILLGRNAAGVKNTISFVNNIISRRHAALDRNHVLDDARSLNGTTINAFPLQYGYGDTLENGDIITLAGIQTLQFFTKRPKKPKIPSETWGIFISGGTYHYLNQPEYSVTINNDIAVISKELNSRAVIKLRYTNDKIQLFDPVDTIKSIMVIKASDYRFSEYAIEEDKWHSDITASIFFLSKENDSNKPLCAPIQCIPFSND